MGGEQGRSEEQGQETCGTLMNASRMEVVRGP